MIRTPEAAAGEQTENKAKDSEGDSPMDAPLVEEAAAAEREAADLRRRLEEATSQAKRLGERVAALEQDATAPAAAPPSSPAAANPLPAAAP